MEPEPLLVIPPVKLVEWTTMPVRADEVSDPLFVIPPAKVETFTSISVRCAVIDPLLMMPKVLRGLKSRTPMMLMPSLFVEVIVPVFLIPPTKVVTLRRMPLFCCEPIVPLLTKAPWKVVAKSSRPSQLTPRIEPLLVKFPVTSRQRDTLRWSLNL